ncbi:hypothetical protein OGAPHI_003985 [Ogataea philodendri]|uniref:Pre-rRNA-processing protein RIX1 N-terminal domain-containing protein n=1 Tax=Ogataea philodendri TaxID=1378263 RepID=A0A9P8P5T3_9ASCO|nr:uncharacterized protein OGAPHI_003985 [Ogataea philodendri]KAH3665797.1 hypothetical protein OGAPHI_003985 [Ogataea philodendri]
MSVEWFPLSSVIPYLEKSKIKEIELTQLITVLARGSTIENASKVDLNHLCARVNTFLSSNDTESRWIGTKLVVVVCTHLEILSSEYTANYLGSLIRILGSKCYIKDEASAPVPAIKTLESCCDALEFIIGNIRGKQTLTRQTLTPKLPAIIGSLLENVTLIPDKTISLLYNLLANNSTTFRPFGSKFETALVSIINNQNFQKFDSALQHKILKSLALISFNLTKNSPSELWRTRFDHFVKELKSTIQIYTEFMSLEEDEDLWLQFNALPSIPADFQPTFSPLQVDLNESSVEVLKVVSRIEVLVNLLVEFLAVPTPQVKVPLNYLVMIGQLLVAINPTFTPIRRDIRDPTLRQTIAYSATLLNHIGLRLLDVLPKFFGGDLLPHLTSILSAVDTLVPVHRTDGKISLNEAGIVDKSELIFASFQTRINYLELVEGFSNTSVLNRSIETAIILLKPRLPDSLANGTEQKLKNVSISDLLADQQLFVTEPADYQKQLLRQFFKVLLTKCQLSLPKQTDILRMVILDAVNGAEVKELLYAALLFPNKEAHASVLPMVKQLLSNDDELMSVFLNPRLPLLPQKRAIEIQEPEEEPEVEDLKRPLVEEERSVKKVKIEDPVVEAEEEPEQPEEQEQPDSDHEEMIFKSVGTISIPEPTLNQQVEEVKPEQSPEQPDEPESELESDFEIPEIDVDED